MQLKDIAQVIRSKNAGPRTTTLDIIFAKTDDYERVRRSGAISAEAIGALYQTAPADVHVIDYPACLAIKVSLPRKLTAGDPGDRDVYGAQQHARLFGLEV